MRETILLVEDNTNDLELALIALEQCKLPHEIVVAHDGEDALHYLKGEGKHADRKVELPTLILLDLKLPKIDGREVLARIRATPSLNQIPVIILSSSSLETDMRYTKALGITDYLVKPIEWKGFSDALCKALSQHMI
jgi:CheY-like chemotaxis protein